MFQRALSSASKAGNGQTHRLSRSSKLQKLLHTIVSQFLTLDSQTIYKSDYNYSVNQLLLAVSMSNKVLSGSCACGNIAYTSTAQPQHLDYCYCLTCQQVSGAPFMAWTGIPKGSLEWHFESPPFTYRAPVGDSNAYISERTCCGKCGCNVLLQYYLYPEKSHIAASTITRNDFGKLEVGCHIWVKHVPAWHSVPSDGIARYEEFDEDFKARLEGYFNRSKP